MEKMEDLVTEDLPEVGASLGSWGRTARQGCLGPWGRWGSLAVQG